MDISLNSRLTGLFRQRTYVMLSMNISDGKNHKNRTEILALVFHLWNQLVTRHNNDGMFIQCERTCGARAPRDIRH